MTDMLVKLYDLPELLPSFSNPAIPEIKIRKPVGSEKSLIVQWVRESFGEFWASEMDITFSRSPVSCISPNRITKWLVSPAMMQAR